MHALLETIMKDSTITNEEILESDLQCLHIQCLHIQKRHSYDCNLSR